MTSENSEPPMAWRYCGNQCKLWRERAGVTRDQLAKEANYEYDSVKSMELGRRKPTPRLLQVADAMCGAQGMLVAALAFLKPEPFPSYSQDFMRYEAEAVSLSSYESLLIPGLLQCEAYARSLINGHWPPLDDETVEERVKGRMERQALLQKQTKAFSFVIEEGVLRRVIGTIDEHRQQLAHLVKAGVPRHVTVQVMPTSEGYHPGLRGPFVLLETPDHEHLAYEEGQTLGVLYAEPAKVSTVSQRHAMILRRALTPEASSDFIGKLAEEL
ncbi:helix-turn-helix transcriptional regulator [Streptomyces sp. NPDC051976]|uniref:helix-turn-helix transcriptional regulator n=1 Tax=Streptomyces sp. NPDC051976 TaxID=3154947 RepID=UPI00342770F9